MKKRLDKETLEKEALLWGKTKNAPDRDGMKVAGLGRIADPQRIEGP